MKPSNSDLRAHRHLRAVLTPVRLTKAGTTLLCVGTVTKDSVVIWKADQKETP